MKKQLTAIFAQFQSIAFQTASRNPSGPDAPKASGSSFIEPEATMKDRRASTIAPLLLSGGAGIRRSR
jgi:hypothetical protein